MLKFKHTSITNYELRLSTELRLASPGDLTHSNEHANDITGYRGEKPRYLSVVTLYTLLLQCLANLCQLQIVLAILYLLKLPNGH